MAAIAGIEIPPLESIKSLRSNSKFKMQNKKLGLNSLKGMSLKKEECLDVYFINGMGMNPFFGLLILDS